MNIQYFTVHFEKYINSTYNVETIVQLFTYFESLQGEDLAGACYEQNFTLYNGLRRHHAANIASNNQAF